MTSDERLRALLDDDLDFDDPRSDVSLTEVEVALRLLGGFYDNSTKAEYVQHLADLIDRPTTTRHGKFKTKYGRETPCCEVCGYSIGDDRWNYCPKCGAEVVD